MKDRTLTPELLERLLNWLNEDREQAALEYEDIRRRLIKMLTCRGCYEQEDVADETIDRVAAKLEELQDYEGFRAPYFYSVCHNVHREWIRGKRKRMEPPPPPNEADQARVEQRHRCLDECMKSQSSENREIVIEYYQQDKRAKIDRRKLVAERLEISINALRIRAFRIRAALQECVMACMKQNGYEIG
jgi:RNA polymerase sigma factor (sigma-70 family)